MDKNKSLHWLVLPWTWSSFVKEESMDCQITSPFYNKLGCSLKLKKLPYITTYLFVKWECSLASQWLKFIQRDPFLNYWRNNCGISSKNYFKALCWLDSMFTIKLLFKLFTVLLKKFLNLARFIIENIHEVLHKSQTWWYLLFISNLFTRAPL